MFRSVKVGLNFCPHTCYGRDPAMGALASPAPISNGGGATAAVWLAVFILVALSVHPPFDWGYDDHNPSVVNLSPPANQRSIPIRGGTRGPVYIPSPGLLPALTMHPRGSGGGLRRRRWEKRGASGRSGFFRARASSAGGGKTEFVCSECGYQSGRRFARCLRCGKFETCTEAVREAPSRARSGRRDGRSAFDVSQLVSMTSAVSSLHRSLKRIPLRDKELNRVFGGGIVPGGVVLLGGDPGIGKSTLALQLVSLVSSTSSSSSSSSSAPSEAVGRASESLPGETIYIAGEETVEQVAERAARLHGVDPALADRDGELSRVAGLLPSTCLLMSETTVDAVIDAMAAVRPALMVVDSIQTMMDENVMSSPGSVAQVRECATRLTQAAKDHRVAVILIGHVTKSGEVAGPRLLEHVVDTVVYLEGERYQQHRILRAVKNRFGSTADIGIFEMTPRGLKGVENPSSLLVSSSTSHRYHNSGSGEDETGGASADQRGREGCALAVVMEGSRPLIAEIQALATTNPPAFPPSSSSPTSSSSSGGAYTPVRRVAIGLDYQRMSVVLAILGRHAGLRFSRSDCWVSVIGGLKLSDAPACDLAMAVALASSRSGSPVASDTCFAAEIGLGGELRPLPQMERRILEAAQFGFRRCVCAVMSRNHDQDAKNGKRSPSGAKTGRKASSRRRRVGNLEVVECHSIADALNEGLIRQPKPGKRGGDKGGKKSKPGQTVEAPNSSSLEIDDDEDEFSSLEGE